MKVPTLTILTLTYCFFIGCQDQPDNVFSPSPTHEWAYYPGAKGGENIVLVSGDEEYRSEEVLPQMAKILSQHHGFNCLVLFAQDPSKPGIVDPNYLNNIPGLENLEKADLMFLFTRFRELPDEQMTYFESYLKKGGPILGIRTATHAFNVKDSTSQWLHYGNNYNGEKETWKGGFGRLVLGEKWVTHHGHHKHQSTRGIIAPEATGHPITNGIKNGDIWGPTDVYGVRLPLPGDSKPIILGQVINRPREYDESDPFYGMRPTDNEVALRNPRKDSSLNVNDPMMPVAWTKTYQIPDGAKGKVFTSTIGASTDLITEGTRRLLVNAVFWLLDKEVPESATVDLVGAFQPSAYQFHDDVHWDKKNIKIEDL